MYSKKNRFWTAVFSLIPGAAEMYMGFMKMGLTLLTLFIGMIALASWMMVEVFVYLAVIVWIYSFFHANHLASMSDEKFAKLEDDYLIHLDNFGVKTNNRKTRGVVAAVLILAGVLLCYNAVCTMIYNLYPENWISYLLQIINAQVIQVICGIAVIAAGIAMIRGKKKELDEEAQTDGTDGIDE